MNQTFSVYVLPVILSAIGSGISFALVKHFGPIPHGLFIGVFTVGVAQFYYQLP